MRILQVCSARTLGGGERHIAALANALSERGHEVFVAITNDSPLADLLGNVPPKNVIVIRMRNALDVPGALKLAKFIREQEIEVVHAHLARDYPLASLAVRRYARLIVTRHVLFPLNRLHRLTLARVARIVAVSNAVAHRLQAQRICDDKKIRVVANGIDVNSFEQAQSEETTNTVRARLGVRRAFLVGALGSMLPIKGHEDLVRAAAIIARRREDVEFVIVGDDEEQNREHRDRVKRLVLDLGLDDRFHVASWSGELAPYYRSLDVYVSSSQTEAFGLSIVEAMACGRAVIATATEGAREIIEDNMTGKIVPIGNAEKISGTIEALLDDAEERARLGGNASNDVRERFGLDRMVDEIEQIYLEVLTGN